MPFDIMNMYTNIPKNKLTDIKSIPDNNNSLAAVLKIPAFGRRAAASSVDSIFATTIMRYEMLFSGIQMLQCPEWERISGVTNHRITKT
jgi:hypothetical protein